MEITRKQYNDALDIVEKYHEQITLKKEELLTKIPDWKGIHVCSTRLKGVLFCAHSWREERNDIDPIYIERITKEQFFRFRNGGVKGWEEFKLLRGY